MKLNFPTGTIAFTDSAGVLWEADSNGQCDIGDLDPAQFYSHGFYCTGISDGIDAAKAAGGMTYVDISSDSVDVTVNPPFSNPQKFDFSAFASSFAHVPKLLRVAISPGFDLAASTDNAILEVVDSDAAGSGVFAYDDVELLNSVGGVTGSGFSKTADLHPYDFNGTTTFNLWLRITAGAGVTLGGADVTIIGYWY